MFVNTKMKVYFSALVCHPRPDRPTSNIPVVMLTALAQDRNRLAGYLSGADHYLVKPVKPQDLITIIEQAIALRSEERTERLRALVKGEDGE